MTELNDEHGRLIDGWLDQQWLEKGLSEHSLESYRRDIRQLAVWLQGQRVSLLQCQRYQLLEFLADRHQQGVSARSVARQLSAVKSFYRWLKREGQIAEDPALLIERRANVHVQDKHGNSPKVLADKKGNA